MKPEKSKWWFAGEMLMMVLLGTAIFLIPRTHDASSESLSRLPSQTKSAPGAPVDQRIPHDYINHALVEISSWDTERIAPLLAEETGAEVSELELGSVATTMRHTLGALETYSEPQPVDMRSDSETAPVANGTAYFVDALYESGAANITLHIVEENGQKALRKLDLSVADRSGEQQTAN